MYATVGALEIDLILLEELQGLHPEALVEARVARVHIIVVGLDLPPEHELEHIGEEVHLRALRLHGVVESGIGVLGEVNLAVDITPPHHVLLHLSLSWERDLGAGGKLVLVGFACLRLSLFGAPLCRLGAGALDGKQSQDDY